MMTGQRLRERFYLPISASQLSVINMSNLCNLKTWLIIALGPSVIINITTSSPRRRHDHDPAAHIPLARFFPRQLFDGIHLVFTPLLALIHSLSEVTISVYVSNPIIKTSAPYSSTAEQSLCKDYQTFKLKIFIPLTSSHQHQ